MVTQHFTVFMPIPTTILRTLTCILVNISHVNSFDFVRVLILQYYFDFDYFSQ